MIDTIEDARNETGKSWAKIALDMECTTQCLSHWRHAKVQVPKHRWKSLARSIGVDPETFNRQQYLKEFAAMRRNKAPSAPLRENPTPSTEKPTQAVSDENNGLLSWFVDLEESPA